MGHGKFHVEERIFMLDCARKYFSPDWIKTLIGEIRAAGLNTLYIHFSEDMGLRLESKQYPWLAGGDHSLCVYGSANGRAEDDGKFITQDEMADIVRFAHAQGVRIVPSFDSPGHMNYAVKRYNRHFGTDIGNYFHKNGQVSIVHGSSIPRERAQTDYSRGIDITNPEAVAFAMNLYREYGTFFRELGCTVFDMGGDELLGFGDTIDSSRPKWRNLDHWDEHARRLTGDARAVAYDAFLLYMNDICAMLRAMGYEEVRMWNDDVYRSFDTDWQRVVLPDPAIAIQYWTPKANDGKNPPSVYLDAGHKLYNFTSFYTYYVLGFGVKNDVTPARIEQEWNAYVFDPLHPENNPAAPDDRIRGGGFCLWTDTPAAETPEEILTHLRPYIAACGRALND